MIRENVLTFPLGLLYALVTTVVVVQANLYADVVLNLYYVIMNAYGWYFWVYGGSSRRNQHQLVPGKLVKAQIPPLVLITLIGTAIMGWYFSTYTDAALPYPDSFTTVASFVAMWMSARKYIESWWLWFVVDIVQVVLYIEKGIFPYALLYLVYLAMAVWGYRAWQLTRTQHSSIIGPTSNTH